FRFWARRHTESPSPCILTALASITQVTPVGTDYTQSRHGPDFTELVTPCAGSQPEALCNLLNPESATTIQLYDRVDTEYRQLTDHRSRPPGSRSFVGGRGSAD
ncbi:hypothetical protein BaRGS_00035576, partial [Batillaria attramentaria]